MTLDDLDDNKRSLLLMKSHADDMVASLKARGFDANKRGGRVAVFKRGLGASTDWIGSFYWDTDKRSWRFYSIRPLVHTWGDLDILAGEMANEHERLQEIEKEWDEYKASKSKKRWKRYVGAVVSFYNRLFG
jgi:hypothetical protein